jgi:hypothetical protein
MSKPASSSFLAVVGVRAELRARQVGVSKACGRLIAAEADGPVLERLGLAAEPERGLGVRGHGVVEGC